MTAKTILVFFLLLCCAVPAQAERMGPKAVEHTLLGAGAGTLVGASAGLCAYGASKNRNADPIVADAIYGLVGGALAGAGGLVVEND
ncbi:hypothetical protein JW933_07280, partial [candidate division FCPU426 bacterium]|nr:hypothetical protein [candidate division FCPU426 bacterium]